MKHNIIDKIKPLSVTYFSGDYLESVTICKKENVDAAINKADQLESLYGFMTDRPVIRRPTMPGHRENPLMKS